MGAVDPLLALRSGVSPHQPGISRLTLLVHWPLSCSRSLEPGRDQRPRFSLAGVRGLDSLYLPLLEEKRINYLNHKLLSHSGGGCLPHH